MLAASDIERMSLAERFQTMEMIWGSFLKAPEAITSPGWHGEILAQRLSKVQDGKGSFLSLEQLRERLELPRL